MRVALAQINPTVGDLTGNRKLVEEAVDRAAAARADLVVLPEMVLTGYPPMDLLEREGFVRDQMRELDALGEASKRCPIALGAVLPSPQGRPKQLLNASVLLADGKRIAERGKSLLPTYDVFDERRYFVAATEREIAHLPAAPRDIALGLTVCEDTWVSKKSYAVDPVAELAAAGAEVILNPSASPWYVDKAASRRVMLGDLAAQHSVPIVFVNQVGGNDELVFDGGSFIADAQGRIHCALSLFEPAFGVFDLDDLGAATPQGAADEPSGTAQLEQGLVLGIRDYFMKQNLPPGAVIGLSGGIDSAVTAHLAVEALGADKVTGVAMPGPYSSDHSVDDAFELAKLLGIEIRKVEIGPVYDAYLQIFALLFGKQESYGLTQQNIQSRIRGATLMAVSNYENRLVLATGNKSELSVGYCTLYGDTVGGIAVLGDVYKQDVYALAHHANRDKKRIPAGTIEKPPSAELAPDQLDSDDLPSYEVLDAVLMQAIEGQRSISRIEAPEGTPLEVAQRIARRLDRNEYKRRQTPLVLRTSTKAFGSGRRLPIVQRYEAT